MPRWPLPWNVTCERAASFMANHSAAAVSSPGTSWSMSTVKASRITVSWPVSHTPFWHSSTITSYVPDEILPAGPVRPRARLKNPPPSEPNTELGAPAMSTSGVLFVQFRPGDTM
jgi:hypothetical protein